MTEASEAVQIPIQFGKYTFDPESGKIKHKCGTERTLSPDLAAMMRLLAEKQGETVNKESLFGVLCEGKTYKPEPKIVDVQICKLRAELKKLPDVEDEKSHIVTVWGAGYQLSSKLHTVKTTGKRVGPWRRGMGQRLQDEFLRTA